MMLIVISVSLVFSISIFYVVITYFYIFVMLLFLEVTYHVVVFIWSCNIYVLCLNKCIMCYYYRIPWKKYLKKELMYFIRFYFGDFFYTMLFSEDRFFWEKSQSFGEKVDLTSFPVVLQRTSLWNFNSIGFYWRKW